MPLAGDTEWTHAQTDAKAACSGLPFPTALTRHLRISNRLAILSRIMEEQLQEEEEDDEEARGCGAVEGRLLPAQLF